MEHKKQQPEELAGLLDELGASGEYSDEATMQAMRGALSQVTRHVEKPADVVRKFAALPDQDRYDAIEEESDVWQRVKAAVAQMAITGEDFPDGTLETIAVYVRGPLPGQAQIASDYRVWLGRLPEHGAPTRISLPSRTPGVEWLLLAQVTIIGGFWWDMTKFQVREGLPGVDDTGEPMQPDWLLDFFPQSLNAECFKYWWPATWRIPAAIMQIDDKDVVIATEGTVQHLCQHVLNSGATSARLMILQHEGDDSVARTAMLEARRLGYDPEYWRG